jgi:mRNA interferase MazF
MPYEFGDVVLVRFPFTNQARFKQRPAVVVSGRAYNLAKRDLVIMAIISRVHVPLNLDEVEITQWQAANLLKPSVIKPVFATLEQNLILIRLGVLASVDQSGLRQVIASVLRDKVTSVAAGPGLSPGAYPEINVLIQGVAPGLR